MKDNKYNRRSILQKVGNAGVLGAAGISVSTVKGAEEHEKIDLNIQSVLGLPQVTNLLETLGHPQPDRVARGPFDTWGQFELYLDDVETSVIEKNDVRAYSVSIPLNVGNLTVTKIGDEFIEAALLDFDSEVPVGVRRKVESRFDLDWPEGTESTLVGTPSNTDFVRETTDSESARLKEIVDGHIETTSAYDNDDGVGYSVVESSEAVRPASRDETNADVQHTRHYVSRDFEHIEAVDLGNGIDSSDIRSQGECVDIIVECASVLLPFPFGCMACAALTAPPAIVACAVAACGPYVFSHAACVYADEKDCI